MPNNLVVVKIVPVVFPTVCWKHPPGLETCTHSEQGGARRQGGGSGRGALGVSGRPPAAQDRGVVQERLPAPGARPRGAATPRPLFHPGPRARGGAAPPRPSSGRAPGGRERWRVWGIRAPRAAKSTSAASAASPRRATSARLPGAQCTWRSARAPLRPATWARRAAAALRGQLALPAAAACSLSAPVCSLWHPASRLVPARSRPRKLSAQLQPPSCAAPCVAGS